MLYLVSSWEEYLKKLIAKMNEYIGKDRNTRFRDERGHYASSALNCLRDQFWKWKKEPITNPTDIHGTFRMAMGTWVENGLRETFFKGMHRVGEHYLGDQVSVGGSNPNWNGYLDLLMASRPSNGDGPVKRYVIEVKALQGVGANMMVRNLEPKKEHAVQLGLYLKDLSEKGITDEGCLFYFLISDLNYTKRVNISARWLPATEEVEFYHVETCFGVEKEISMRYNIKELALERWKKLDKYIADNIVPEPDYVYKYPVDSVEVASQSKWQLEKAINGEKVLGDWQVAYSPYKEKILEVDGLSPGYTEEERQALIRQYKVLVPNTRKFK
jgi:hypothetical protein